MWYNKDMGRYVFNKGKALAIYGALATIQPGQYDCFNDELIERLKTTTLPLVYEDDPGFQPLWIGNIPEKTPNQIP